MEDRFLLLLSLKTQVGFDVFGEFGIGNDGEAENLLFDSLKGDERLRSPCILHIDLMERENLLPKKIRTKCCNLDELAANCIAITRKVFQQKTLEDCEEYGKFLLR
ncbi:hypothetical protein LJ707_17610 [Mucilaginibacter sp. UR6-1]|uniref:hypothetical protein n=1 Tax=Mucilaginibacter sp. UR6-1 TaxID=1435643 RepID=UPI001E4BF7F0|nr:hypothetical protein [Mucilaginibacter sp. UR6-1]MCC8410763.1 hypothetical protein [Mucilaginibacter sp. UR6-1]